MSAGIALVLDNNLFLRPKLESDLAAQGWTVRYATTAARFREILDDEDPSVVFVNLAARGLPWAELVGEVRRDFPGVPVIGFGPHVDEALAEVGSRAGCAEVVPNGLVARSASRVAARHVPRTDG